jgi:hypothetical protein
MKKSDRKGKSTAKRATKDLPPRASRAVKAGFSSVSNVLKTRHDTAKNSIGN